MPAADETIAWERAAAAVVAVVVVMGKEMENFVVGKEGGAGRVGEERSGAEGRVVQQAGLVLDSGAIGNHALSPRPESFT